MRDKVVEIVREADKLIMEVYASGDFDMTVKDDESPLTRADIASNSYIVDALNAAFGIPIISEEIPVDIEERMTWDRFWLVDPLDGTKDFIARNDEFTVNVALIEDGVPTIGVIGVPALDTIYSASSGSGAFIFHNGTDKRLVMKANRKLIVGTSRFHSSPKIEEFMAMNGISESRSIGSALKFCALAAGDITIYPRFSGSKEWDIAAGHCILREAGCSFRDLVTGQEPAYNKIEIRNNFFISAAPWVDIDSLLIPSFVPPPSP